MPLHAQQPADNALKSKMAAPGDANQKAFHVLLEIHSTWERCEQIERASVQTLFHLHFLVSSRKKHGKEDGPPLSPAFSSLSKHSRLEAFKQTTNRWFVTIAWDGTGERLDFYSAFSHTQEKWKCKVWSISRCDCLRAFISYCFVQHGSKASFARKRS